MPTVNAATLRAASRLSPRQLGYHVKRKGRNVLAQRRPSAYAAHIEKVAGRLAPLRDSALRDESVLGLASSVTRFYYDEYRDVIDDAAAGRFTFFGQSADFGDASSVDWHHQVPAETDFHLWRMKLGHMGFVCPMLIVGDDRHLAAVKDMLAAYRRNSSFGVPDCFSSYWFPYSVSHRVLAILSGYLVARQKRELPADLCAEIESFLRWNVGFIVANVEHELKNNHVERNLAALCLYFSCTDSVPPVLARRLDREVRRVIDACVLPDGFIAERSAMYQGLSVMALDVFTRSPFLSDSTRADAGANRRRAEAAWLTMSHPDGQIALFNDSWFDEVPEAGQVVPKTTRTLDLLPEAGYARLESDRVFALMDAGPIGPRWNPGHGHADFLSVEVDIDGYRFVVDPGTYQYSTGPRRAFERSAQSHNGPIKSAVEPVEYLGCFRVGRMTAATILSHETFDDGSRATGRLELPDGTSVVRAVEVAAGMVTVTDQWLGKPDGAHVRLTIPAEWSLVERAADRMLFRQHQAEAELCLLDGDVGAVEAGAWSCRYLESRDATVVELRPRSGHSAGAKLVWTVGSTAADTALSDRGSSKTMGMP